MYRYLTGDGKHQNIGHHGLGTGDFPWLPPWWIRPVRTYVRVDRIVRPSHDPPPPQKKPLWTRISGIERVPPSLWRSPRWVAPAEGSDDNPGRFASGCTQWKWKGLFVKIIPSMVCFPPVRHERSHIMYWNCGRNRLMSLSNVSRDGRAQSPIPVVDPTVKERRSISVTSVVLRSQIGIGSRVWGTMCFSAQTNTDTRG